MYKFCILLCCVCALPASAQNSPEVEKIRKQLEAQQQQLDAQRRMLDQVSRVHADPGDQTAASAKTAVSGSQTDLDGKPLSPLSFHIGGADFTPGGFLDLSTVWRSTNVGSGVATAFGSIPANSSAAGQLSEWRFSEHNSRLTLKVSEKPLKNVLATGYFEVDFAGSLPSNAYVTGNGLTFRMRQAYVNVQVGKFEVLGGQAWTLITPNRVGTSPAPSDVFLGLGQDSSYLAGLVFVRQSQFRATYHMTPSWTLAFSVENPQQYVTNATVLPTPFAAQFDTSSGNPSIANPRPDIAAKLALDTKIGHRPLHFEIAGVSRQFRTLTPDHIEHSAQGVGGTMTLIVEPAKNFRWILTSFYSSGGGRYIMGMGPDVMVAPDGSISPVHSMSGITGFEYLVRPSSQIYGYYSGAYFSRNYVTLTPGNYVGFGFPGSSGTANRQIQEATAGYAHIFWKNPNYGSFQAMGQYAFVTRSPWHTASPRDSDMHTHMAFIGLRFSLP